MNVALARSEDFEAKSQLSWWSSLSQITLGCSHTCRQTQLLSRTAA